MDHETKNRLDTIGWVEFPLVTSDADILQLSQKIGQVIPHPNGQLIFKLNSNNGQDAPKGSFSNKFGFNSFPLHTDTAFWTTPARYILFYSKSISSCPTLLVPANDILRQVQAENAERAIFKVKTSRGQFYSSLLFNINNVRGIKYDPNCMIPVNKFAKSFVDSIGKLDFQRHEIRWAANKVVIVDNWKVLHGRGAASKTELRELLRIYIN